MVKVESSSIIKTLNAVLALTSKEEVVNFRTYEGSLLIFTESLTFQIESEGEIKEFSIDSLKLKGVSTLKASLVEEYMTISKDEMGLCTFASNMSFQIASQEVVAEPMALESGLEYIPSKQLKILSKFLGKFSKDNFSGTILAGKKGFLIPGEYHITEIECDCFNEEGDTAYAIKHTSLNKLLKLGQDLSISREGLVSSEGDINYKVQLPLGNKKALIALNIEKIRDLYSGDSPVLKILEPKVFKDFIKNTKSSDTQYDLVRVRTEKERICLDFYRDKKPLSKFVYSKVETPENYIEFYLQVKHLTAISELSTDNIEVTFVGADTPIKFTVDDTFSSYILPSQVI